MSHSQARFPHTDIGGRFAYDDTKDESEAASTNSTGASHCELQASHSHTSDLGSDDTITHAEPDSVDLAATPRLTASSDEQLAASIASLDQTAPRVRFRSRVRISAGMSRRRRLSDGIYSSASSVSSSSSISAPLRTHPTGKNGWGTLGSRVNPLSSPHAAAPVHGSQYANGGKGHDDAGDEYGNPRTPSARSSLSFLDDDVNERTHLVTTATTRPYVRDRYAHDWYLSERERERRWREQLMDEAFGKWPGRLLNRHWWWWHVEPVLCFLCDDPEEEE